MLFVMQQNNSQRYNTKLDEEIMSIGGVPDEHARYQDIHETLFYSKSCGFYLERRIRQRLEGRTWETLELGEFENPCPKSRFRFLQVFRPMSRDQVIRFVLENHMPTKEGIRDEALRILNLGPVPGQQQQQQKGITKRGPKQIDREATS
jgi:hypothetical protein